MSERESTSQSEPAIEQRPAAAIPSPEPTEVHLSEGKSMSFPPSAAVTEITVSGMAGAAIAAPVTSEPAATTMAQDAQTAAPAVQDAE